MPVEPLRPRICGLDHQDHISVGKYLLDVLEQLAPMPRRRQSGSTQMLMIRDCPPCISPMTQPTMCPAARATRNLARGQRYNMARVVGRYASDRRKQRRWSRVTVMISLKRPGVTVTVPDRDTVPTGERSFGMLPRRGIKVTMVGYRPYRLAVRQSAVGDGRIADALRRATQCN